MSYVPRREKNRQAFSTSKGRALVEKMQMRTAVENHLKSLGMTGEDASFGRPAVKKVDHVYDQEQDK